MIDKRPRIIDVKRKPQKCPVCGERVVDIIYGTGDMTEIECVGSRTIAIDAVGKNEGSKTLHYKVEVRTELGEQEIVKVTAVDEQDAEDMALSLVMKGAVGLKGRVCTYNVVVEEE